MNPPYTPTTKKPMTTPGCHGDLMTRAVLLPPGLSSDHTVSASIAIDSVRLNATLGISSASHTPSAAPATAGTLADNDHRQSTTPCRWKPASPPRFCASTPTRLVPLARAAGRPANSNRGRIRKEPPPPITFSAPAATPAAASSVNSSQKFTSADRTPQPDL